MKKVFLMMLVLAMVIGSSVAQATDMGVQVIGGPETETEPVSLDDLKLEVPAEIEGWGTLTLTSYEVQDGLGYYIAGRSDVRYRDDYYWSGEEAQFAILYIDILNTQIRNKNYLETVNVKAVYDDTYEYAGWFYQRNYDNKTDSYPALDADKDKENTRWAIDVSDQFAIEPMYTGHYLFGCTLPNAVIEGKAPLKLIVTINGNEITYNIRK